MGGCFALGHGNQENLKTFKEVSYLTSLGREIKKVSAGLTHSGCITNDGKVFLWGLNGDPKLSPELKSKILMKAPTEILFN